MAVNPLAMILKGFGIEIDPEEIIRMIQAMAKDIADMRASIKATEANVNALLLERQTDGKRYVDGYLQIGGGDSIREGNGSIREGSEGKA